MGFSWVWFGCLFIWWTAIGVVVGCLYLTLGEYFVVYALFFWLLDEVFCDRFVLFFLLGILYFCGCRCIIFGVGNCLYFCWGYFIFCSCFWSVFVVLFLCFGKFLGLLGVSFVLWCKLC